MCIRHCQGRANALLRKMIACCKWTFAKTMPWTPHEYIVRGKFPLTEEEFLSSNV